MDPAMEQGMRDPARKTAPAMERHPVGKIFCRYGRAAGSALLFLLTISICLTALPVWSQDKDIVLPGSGIHYPGGFDFNTAGEIRGRVEKITKEQGPVQVQVRSERDVYTVLTGPSWYWDKIKADISENMEIKIRGSKALGADGRLYMIAQEITPPKGEALVFRDEEGYPAWSASAGSGQKAGFGSPMRGGGSGPARGGAGAGHGRR